jgi:hypothetical protein
MRFENYFFRLLEQNSGAMRVSHRLVCSFERALIVIRLGDFTFETIAAICSIRPRVF